MKKNIFLIGAILVLSSLFSSCGEPIDPTKEDDITYIIRYDGQTYDLFDECDDFVKDENGNILKQKDVNGNEIKIGNLPQDVEVKKGTLLRSEYIPVLEDSKGIYEFDYWSCSLGSGQNELFMKEVTKDITLYAHWKVKEIDRADVYDSYLILSNEQEIQFTMNNSIKDSSDNYNILNKNTDKKYIVMNSGLDNYKTKVVFKDLENGKKLPKKILEYKKENPDKIEINGNTVVFKNLEKDYLYIYGDYVDFIDFNVSERDETIYYFDDNFMKMNVSQWEETVYKPIFEKLDILLTDENYDMFFPEELKESEAAKLKNYNSYLEKILLNSELDFSLSSNDLIGFDLTYDNKNNRLLNCFKFNYNSNKNWLDYKEDDVLNFFRYFNNDEIYLLNDSFSEYPFLVNKKDDKYLVELPRFKFAEITNCNEKCFSSSWNLLFSYCTDESILNEIIKSFEVVSNNKCLVLKENDNFYVYKDYLDADIEYNVFLDGILYVK